MLYLSSTTLIDSLRPALFSFINNYQAVMWRLRTSTLSDQQLGTVVRLSGNAIRNRRSKPDLWKLSDIEYLADHFGLTSGASVKLARLLRELSIYLEKLPDQERRQLERLLVLKTNQIASFNRNDWPVHRLLHIHNSLMVSTQ